jgi:hypothetical protein
LEGGKGNEQEETNLLYASLFFLTTDKGVQEECMRIASPDARVEQVWENVCAMSQIPSGGRRISGELDAVGGGRGKVNGRLWFFVAEVSGHENIDDIYRLVVTERRVRLKSDDCPLERVLRKGRGRGLWYLRRELRKFGALFFLIALTMLAIDVTISDIPCPAKTDATLMCCSWKALGALVFGGEMWMMESANRCDA